MVIVKLMGGLGNQMFQYAVGRSLSIRLQSELKIDHSFLEADTKEQYTKRHYELNAFNCIQTKVTENETKNIEQLQKTGTLSKLYNSLFIHDSITIFKENGFPYHQEIENQKGDIYLSGFWQSEKYFTTIRETLLKDFSLKIKLSEEAEILKAKIISDEQSVSIHFRRGDYVNLAAANTFHGTTELDYYHSSIDKIKSQLNNPSFYIFSDDMNWVKENFKIENAIYIDDLKSQEDLELMKNCKNNIIANSSFSWWAAWLNANSKKIIIAPKQWFKDTTINTIDLIPETWIKN